MNIFPKKIMLLGSGELGKEVAIAAKRLGCYVIACDRYENAPAMQISDQFSVLNMNNADELKEVISDYKPDIIIPEIEALAVDLLREIEKNIIVIPNARATAITMNRDKIRDLASNELNLRTAKFSYAINKSELKTKANQIGYPLLIKPVMSSSGKGQSLVYKKQDLDEAWNLAIEKSRGKSKKIIIEEFIEFDLEITLLTIRQTNGQTLFCSPIGHEQKDGDYQCSWQPAELQESVLEEAQQIAKCVTDNLGGVGLFGVEFFIKGEEVIFSELSPRPHDTGLVTLISQNINEFELHLRAVLGIPIPEIICDDPSASRVILATQNNRYVSYKGIEDALSQSNTNLFMFGKPTSTEGRRMGVAVAKAKTIEEARLKADKAAQSVQFINE
mgnify:CR=1 FL=1|tara:strand:+ start:488 stop:1651 length:1164 start_codon:yes stop_codon:yes gene_type:complete